MNEVDKSHKEQLESDPWHIALEEVHPSQQTINEPSLYTIVIARWPIARGDEPPTDASKQQLMYGFDELSVQYINCSPFPLLVK